jgi:hypothetical protein
MPRPKRASDWGVETYNLLMLRLQQAQKQMAASRSEQVLKATQGHGDSGSPKRKRTDVTDTPPAALICAVNKLPVIEIEID